MLLTLILVQTLIIGMLSVIAIGLAAGLYMVLTGRWPTWQVDAPTAVDYRQVPPVLHRVRGVK